MACKTVGKPQSMVQTLSIVLAAFFMVLLAGCGDGTRELPDISTSSVSVEMERFDQQLMQQDPAKVAEWSPELYRQYGRFYKIYIESIIRLGNVNDPVANFQLAEFISDGDVRAVQDSIDAVWSASNTAKAEAEIEQAFQYYNAHFPERLIPRVVTMNSAFNFGVAPTDSTVGLGLDFYLGSQYSGYRSLQFLNAYQVRRMIPEQLPADCMRGWLETEFYRDEEDKSLLASIVHYGKVLYALEQTLPTTHDSLLIGYSAAQEAWCRENEFGIWTHFVENKLLYTTDHNEIMKYTGEAPFTSGLDRQSPGKLGIWLGWQIVRSFMADNEHVSLIDLMENFDAPSILNQSGYRPQR